MTLKPLSSPPPVAAPARRTESFSRVGRIGVMLATLAVYAFFVHAWRCDRPTVITPPHSAIQTVVEADLYALLARGFLHGHLYLDTAPPKELASAADPYDPVKRPTVLYLHDASLYHGKYYIYFGPTAAALLYAPWRLVTGHDLPTPWAVFIFVSLAYVGGAAFVARLRRDLFPQTPPGLELAAWLTLGAASLWLPLVRRPSAYEVAIASGCAAVVWAFYCAWRARTDRSGRWSAACGLLVGLAAAARPTLGLAAIPATILMWHFPAGMSWRAIIRNRRWWCAAAAGSLCLAALLAYNAARFGRPLEFGQGYQLSSENEGAIHHFSVRFIPAQLWFYLLAPLRASLYFPFVRDVAAARLPAGFGGHEYSFGLWANLPVLWFAVVAWFVGWRQRAYRSVIAGLTVGAVVAIAPLLMFFGSCVRYEAEFALPLTLLAIVGMFVGGAAIAARWRRWLVRGALTLGLLAWGTVFFAAIDMYDGTENMPPPAFDSLGRWLNRPLVWRNGVHGLGDGAVELTIQPGNGAPARTLVSAIGPDGNAESLSFERIDAAYGRLRAWRAGEAPYEVSADVALGHADHHVIRASFGGLYPLRPVEMPEPIDREQFRALKLWVRVDWDGHRVIERSVPKASWRTRHIQIAPRGADETGVVVLTSERVAPRIESAPARPGGVHLVAVLGPEQAGRFFPLGVTGYDGRGDFLFVRVERGRLTFGYDHWGKPIIESQPVPFEAGRHVIEYWMPSMRSLEEPRPLIVRLDGGEVWNVAVPFYPATSDELFIAHNPLGGSSCEGEFTGATIEATNLADP